MSGEVEICRYLLERKSCYLFKTQKGSCSTRIMQTLKMCEPLEEIIGPFKTMKRMGIVLDTRTNNEIRHRGIKELIPDGALLRATFIFVPLSSAPNQVFQCTI
jgi:hypothetical protein